MYRIRPWLLVGKYRETLDHDLLGSHEVSAMLQLAAPVEHDGIASLYLSVEDGIPLPIALLEEGVKFIRKHKAEGHIVMVACGAGVSRSVTFAMAALMEEENLPLPDSYREVYLHHREAMPNPELYRSLAAYHGVQMSLVEAWDEIFRVQQESR